MNRHIPQLDGLRAIAILLVLLTHFWKYPEGYPLLNLVAQFGWVGVDLFFVLSGFLITGILIRTREDQRYFANFYARRSLRIFPIYILLLLLVFVVLPQFSTLPDRVNDDKYLYFFYLSNVALAAGGWQLFLLDITWTLSVEEQFYIIWPFLVKVLNQRWLARLCVVLILLVPFVRWFVWNEFGWMWTYMMTPLRADAFAFGAIVAIVGHQQLRRLAIYCLYVGFPLLMWLVLTGSYKRDSLLVATGGYTLNALVAAASLVLVLGHRKGLLSTLTMRHIGKVSYGMYIYHPLCLVAASFLLHTGDGIAGSLIQLLVVSFLTIGVASISFYVFEIPFLQLKRRFASAANNKKTAR